jgi:hypothetical protein
LVPNEVTLPPTTAFGDVSLKTAADRVDSSCRKGKKREKKKRNVKYYMFLWLANKYRLGWEKKNIF